jgi:hypothetical protein
MFKTLLILTALTFSVVVFAETETKSETKPLRQLTKREKLILEVKYKVDREMVLGILRKYNNDIALGIKNKKPLKALQYYTFAAAIEKEWLKCRWFTADTGLNINWLKKIHKLMLYMNKTQKYIETAEFNGETKTPKYKKALEYLKTAQERFAKLIKNPVRVPSKILEKEKKEKLLWQKAMQKKYDIKI